MNSSVRNAVLWLIILCLVVLVWARRQRQQAAGAAAGVFGVWCRTVKDGKVDNVSLNSTTGDINGKYKNGDEFHSTVPPTYNDFTTLLLDKGVT